MRHAIPNGKACYKIVVATPQAPVPLNRLRYYRPEQSVKQQLSTTCDHTAETARAIAETVSVPDMTLVRDTSHHRSSCAHDKNKHDTRRPDNSQ